MKRLLSAFTLAAVACASQADTLDFSGSICSANADGSGSFTACVTGSRINQAYGDTGQVNVTYLDSIAGTNSMFFWDTQYSGLTNVAYGGSGATPVITLAAIGSTVMLQNFQLGAWPNADRPSQVTVIDLATNLAVTNTGPITVLGASPSLFTINASSTVGFAIQFGPDGFNVGIDNINFTTTPVPEASTYAMMLAGLVAMGAAARRSRKI